MNDRMNKTGMCHGDASIEDCFSQTTPFFAFEFVLKHTPMHYYM